MRLCSASGMSACHCVGSTCRACQQNGHCQEDQWCDHHHMVLISCTSTELCSNELCEQLFPLKAVSCSELWPLMLPALEALWQLKSWAWGFSHAGGYLGWGINIGIVRQDTTPSASPLQLILRSAKRGGLQLLETKERWGHAWADGILECRWQGNALWLTLA